VSDLVLEGGTLVLEDRVEKGDLVVRGGRIAAAGAGVPRAADAEVIDCRGELVFPGLVDLHVHVDDRIGAFELADTWGSGSRIAIATGVTSLAAFATQPPRGARTVMETVDAASSRARGRSFCDFALHTTPTRWEDGAWRALEELTARGHRTIKLYTTYASAGLLATEAVVARALARGAELGLTVLLHCEDDEVLARAAADPEIDWSAATAHAISRPVVAEQRAVERAIELCRRTGGRLHVVHVSTPAAARLIREAAAELPLTCETCPQYLALDDAQLARPDGWRWLCSPPLRDAEARDEMLDLARRGFFDVLATDHCAFSRADKMTGAGRDVRETPSGVAGLGALAPLGRELLLADAPDEAALLRFARMLSGNPARILGLHPRKGSLTAGADADVVVARLDAEPAPIRSSLADVHETYENRSSRWRASRVYLRGRLAAEGGRVVESGAPKGEPAWG
jgi:dihydropyrimidinase